MEGLGKRNMNIKGDWGFMLDFCRLHYPPSLNILCTFWWFLSLRSLLQGGRQKPHVSRLSCTWDGCLCVTGFVNWATQVGLDSENSNETSWPDMGESQSSGCGEAMVSTSCGQQWKFLVAGPKQGMLSRGGSDVSLENPPGWLEFQARWLRGWLLVPF